MKPLLPFIILLTLYSSAFAEEYNNNQRAAVYLHPIFVMGLLPPNLPFIVQLTGEVPISKFNSLIIDPSLVMWEKGSDEYLFKLGSGIGWRHFFSEDASGVYLQPMISAYYVRIKEALVSIGCSGINDCKVKDYRGTNTGVSAGILGYIGYSKKYSVISVFADIGLGYAWSNVHNYHEDDPISLLGLSSAFSYDLNFGIGIPF